MIIIDGVEYEINRDTAKVAEADHKYYQLLETMDDSYEELKYNQGKDYNMLCNAERIIQECDDDIVEKTYNYLIRRIKLRQKYGSTYDSTSYLYKDFNDRLRLKEIFKFLITKSDKDDIFDEDNKVSKLCEDAKFLVKKDKQKKIVNNVK